MVILSSICLIVCQLHTITVTVASGLVSKRSLEGAKQFYTDRYRITAVLTTICHGKSDWYGLHVPSQGERDRTYDRFAPNYSRRLRCTECPRRGMERTLLKPFPRPSVQEGPDLQITWSQLPLWDAVLPLSLIKHKGRSTARMMHHRQVRIMRFFLPCKFDYAHVHANCSSPWRFTIAGVLSGVSCCYCKLKPRDLPTRSVFSLTTSLSCLWGR